MPAHPPPNEAQRLKATEDYAVNGQPADGEFDAVVALAAEICETPIAVVSFIGETEMWLRAAHGYRDWRTSPREFSFCAHNLQSPDLLVVPDAAADPRFAQNPFVTGEPNIRFYASAPIITRTGETLGALCVIDRVPRQLQERQLAALRVLSQQVMKALELRRELNQRKRADADLREGVDRLRASEAEYRTLFSSHPQPMWILDLATRGFLEVNAAAQRHYGYSEQEFLRMTTFDIRPPADAAELAQHPERLDAQGARTVRSRHLKRDGTQIEVEVTSSNLVFAGRPARLAMVTDITQKVRAELEAERARRALQMLSDCNEALIREDDERRLLAAICRMAVEIGQVRMAWVGYASEDEGHLIVPQAHAGFNEGYLEQLRLSWSEDSATADRPCARTIRNGEPTVIPDLAADATFRPWLEAAQARGYRGMIALPLKEDGRPFGMLALYLAEARDLPTEELKLVREFADNLAFGIVNLRARLERRKTTDAVLAMARGVSLSSDRDFFTKLTHSLVEALGAEVGMIGERLTGNPGMVRTLGAVVHGQTELNFDYALAGTPCENLDGSELWLETKGVAQRYAHLPNLMAWGIQAYLGINLLDASGERIGLVCVEFCRTITQPDFLISTLKIFAARAAAELQRRRAEARTREQAEMLDKAQDAILVRDLEHRITFWNKSAERVYGWTAEEALGRSVLELLNIDEATFHQAMKHLLAVGEWAGELTQVRKDGQKLAVEIRWTLVRNDAGQPRAVLAINTDITERRKLEQQFLRAQRMESIGTLAGGIAHDLNNLLAPITMGVDLLSRFAPDPKSLPILESMQRSAKRGADLVKQVLSFARGVEGTRTALQVAPLLREVESIAQNTFPRNIEIHARAVPEVWPVVADATQLNQVLLNLCVNARDAMPDGGRIELQAYNIQIDAQTAALNRGLLFGRYVVLQVTDTGSGIPPQIVDRIFEPFFTTKEVGKGTGLGLSTVMTIARSHGGSVTVYSEPNKGSVFKVYLPAQPEVGPAIGPSPLEEKFPRGNGELILVVDDEAAILDIVRQSLETFGYRVVGAADGAEAIAVYAQRSAEIALVLTDMMMPVMDGLALIVALRRIRPEVIVVAASGLTVNGNLTRALNLGVTHFLAKPYAVDAMLQTFRKALTEQAGAGTASGAGAAKPVDPSRS